MASQIMGVVLLLGVAVVPMGVGGLLYMIELEWGVPPIGGYEHGYVEDDAGAVVAERLTVTRLGAAYVDHPVLVVVDHVAWDAPVRVVVEDPVGATIMTPVGACVTLVAYPDRYSSSYRRGVVWVQYGSCGGGAAGEPIEGGGGSDDAPSWTGHIDATDAECRAGPDDIVPIVCLVHVDMV